MVESSSTGSSLTRAREMFFQEGLAPDTSLEPHISRSWLRSRKQQALMAPLEPLGVSQLDERRDQAMRLLACAQPELDGLAEHALDQGCVVVLSDADGLILQEIGSPDFLPKAERYALKPGVAWSEGSCGTNAIGTALIEKTALMVLGGEHYLARHAGLGCAATPIFDGRGEVAGVLDISGEAHRMTSDALGLVRMAARQVEHRMLLSQAQGHLLRFHSKPGLIGTSREGLVVIDDGRIVAANRFALDMFRTNWETMLDRSAERLLGRPWGRAEPQRGLLTLPDGRQVAGIVERAGSTAQERPAHRPVLHAQRWSAAVDDVQPLLERALRVVDAGVPVLITGETGTGKDVFARRLHASSRRRAGPFVAIDCASIPENLIEAELFGYEEGAFTGARRRGMRGRIREADGGMLFLDEIAEMPLALQARLLRVLEERTVVPLGGGRGVPVDFDLVCATHQDLGALTDAGRFRSDLMYRVAGFCVSVPALRERRDRRDLILRLFDELGGARRGLSLSEPALSVLDRFAWPGNVRELRSVLTTLVALAQDSEIILPENLPEHLRVTQSPQQVAAYGSAVSMPPDRGSVRLLKDAQREAIDDMLAQCAHDVAETARRLGLHRSTVYRHIGRRKGGN